MDGAFIIVLIGLLVINLALISWAIMDIMPRKNVKYLPKIGWIVFFTFIIFGSVVYLFVGRGED